MRQPVSHGRARRSQTASVLRSATGSALRSRHDATSAAAVQDPSRPVSFLSLGALGLAEIGTPPQRRSPWFPFTEPPANCQFLGVSTDNPLRRLLLARARASGANFASFYSSPGAKFRVDYDPTVILDNGEVWGSADPQCSGVGTPILECNYSDVFTVPR